MPQKAIQWDGAVKRWVLSPEFVEASEVTTTPTAHAIPRANEHGELAAGWIPAGASGGETTFLGLSDTPSSYSGQAGKAAVVTATEDGLVFVAVGGGGGSGGGTIWSQTPMAQFPIGMLDE